MLPTYFVTVKIYLFYIIYLIISLFFFSILTLCLLLQDFFPITFANQEPQNIVFTIKQDVHGNINTTFHYNYFLINQKKFLLPKKSRNDCVATTVTSSNVYINDLLQLGTKQWCQIIEFSQFVPYKT